MTLPRLFLRSRIVLLFAMSSLALAALVAIPLLLTLRQSERITAEERRGRQTSDWQRSLESVGERLLTAASAVTGDPRLVAAAGADDRETARRLLDARRPEAGWPAGMRIDLLGPAGQLLTSSAGISADAPMVDVARFLGEQAGEAHTVSVEAADPGKRSDGALLVVVTRRLAGGGAISVGGGIEAAARAFSELERNDAFVADRGRRLLAATRPDLWPAVLRAATGADSVARLTPGGPVASLVSLALLNASLDQVGWLFSISDDTLRADRQTLLFVLSGGLSAGVFAVLCLFFYGYIKESLDPLTDVARTMRAVASGDTMASVEVPGRRDEVGDIVRAMEVFRRNAMELERLRLRGALLTRQQQSLIRSEMARLAATLEPDARDEMLADLREIETRQGASGAPAFPRQTVPAGEDAAGADTDAADADFASTDAGSTGPGSTGPGSTGPGSTGLGSMGPGSMGPGGTDPGLAGSALATAFRTMAGRVMAQHRKLDTLLAERTRDLETVRQALSEREHLSYLRRELEVARELQLSSLPKVFPAFPDHPEFDLFATMVPAQEVGGDFYDFSLLPDGRLALFIGDAAGKGVSAAMFIAMARSLLRSAVVRGATPGEALEQANATLAVENPSMMFATAFVALLDPRTGRLVYAGAGHNPPYLRTGDGCVRALPVAQAIALGVEGEWRYATTGLDLARDDVLLMFTDGVTEAVGPGQCFFQEARLIDTIAAARSPVPFDLVAAVQRAVAAFSADEPQADDITLLCLRWIGA